MKKALALGAFAIAMAFPLVSSAASVVNTFIGSSSFTGSNDDLVVSDTIQFEVEITTDGGVNIDTLFWSLTGDAANAVGSTQGCGWCGVDNIVTNWVWHYTPPGGGKMKLGTNGRFTPNATGQASPVGNAVSSAYGFFGTSKTGDGNPALVGTVTIHATAAGQFQGGGFHLPGVDGFFGSAGASASTISGGEFTVVPEPGTALLMFLGLGGLGVMGRRNR